MIHSSLWRRRTLLSGALLSAFGLAATPSSAQKLAGANKSGAGGIQPIGIMPPAPVNPPAAYPPIRHHITFPPARKITTPQQAQDYLNAFKTLNPCYKRANLRAAMKQVAKMPVFGASGVSSGGGPVTNNAPGVGPFSFGTTLDSLSAHANAAPVGPIGTVPIANGLWQNVAPRPLTPLDNIFFGPSYVTGRINACTIDPANSNIAYIAAPVGGIWKTLNGGNAWTPTTESLSTQSFSSLTIDPTNHNTLYAGSGDYDGGDEYGGGLFRSVDGGSTWQNLDPDGTVFGSHSIRQVAVDPTNPNNVLVAVGRDGVADVDFVNFRINVNYTGGVYQSTNATSANPSFTPVLSPTANCHTVTFNSNGTVAYAAMESYYLDLLTFQILPLDDDGVYSSTDHGATWTKVLQPYTTGVTTGANMFLDIATSKLNPNVLYAATSDLNTAYDAVLKSTDGGATWTDTTSNFPQALDPRNGVDHAWDQSFYDFYIGTATQPSNPASDAQGIPSAPIDVVYVGLKDVYQSPNAGRTWGAIGQVSLAPNSFTFNDQMHTDQHAIGVDPSNANNVLLGNDGGVYGLRYNPLDNFRAISDLNASLVVTEFYQTVFHPTSADTILGGSQDNGTNYSFGSLFGWNGVTGGDGSGVAINAQTPLTMYSCYPGSQNGPTATMNINLTDDGWQTVKSISHDDPMGSAEFVQVIALDPQNYNHLYAGTNNLWLYDHAANSWTEILDANSNNKPLGGNVTAIAPSGIPAAGNEPIVYVGCSDGSFYTVVPNGKNPTTAVNIVAKIQFRGSISSIVVSRVNPRRVFVTTTAGEVYRCDDAIGSNLFNDITGSGQVTDPTHLPPLLPINTITLASQDDEQVIFAGTDLGVFASSDGGSTWGTLSVPFGLPNTKINNLDFNASTGYLSAGTFGRGVWRIPITTLPTTIYQKALVHFAPILQSYRGAKSGMRVLIEVRKPGSPNTSLPVETHMATMLANGTFDVPFAARGHYDIYLTIPRFLRKKLADVVTTSSPTVSPLMINGDTAIPPLPVTPPALPGPPRFGADNVIDANDVNLIRLNLGLYTNSTLDLDGDGRVTSNDVIIAQGNQGKRGD